MVEVLIGSAGFCAASLSKLRRVVVRQMSNVSGPEDSHAKARRGLAPAFSPSPLSAPIFPAVQQRRGEGGNPGGPRDGHRASTFSSALSEPRHHGSSSSPRPASGRVACRASGHGRRRSSQKVQKNLPPFESVCVASAGRARGWVPRVSVVPFQVCQHFTILPARRSAILRRNSIGSNSTQGEIVRVCTARWQQPGR